MDKKSPTREDVIQALKELEAEGIPPGRKALEGKGINGYWIAKLIPEGLTELKLNHGIKISPQERSYSDDELLEKIDETVSHLGGIPSWAQLRRETKISDKVFIKRFGNKGIREVISHYCKWLEQHHPESENIKLVDVYFTGQSKRKTPAESKIQGEIQNLLTPAEQILRNLRQTDDFLATKLRPESSTHCDHCGNRTFKIWIGSYEAQNSEQDLVEYELYRCTICQHVILQKKSKKNVEQLWPPSLEFPPDVPERIRRIYDEARYVKSKSPSSFVVQVRRALEAVTKERNAEGRALFDKINWLIQNEHLPQVFGEMSHISRLIANLGAHDAEIDVKLNDADIVDEFFRAIIEYIYIAPAKVARIKALMEKN